MKIKIDLDNSSERKHSFKLSIPVSQDTEITKYLSEYEVKEIVDKIAELFGYKELMESFNINYKEAEAVSNFWDKNRTCSICSYKLKECHRCVNICQSPLERDLLLELVENNITTELQLRLNKDGSLEKYPAKINKDTILTIPDFYIENEQKKICIYTDGHTYHERTEHQAMRDRNIDRELQSLGFMVLRFTGKEIREKMQSVIDSIKKNLAN